jgi:hypothetical protein
MIVFIYTSNVTADDGGTRGMTMAKEIGGGEDDGI